MRDNAPSAKRIWLGIQAYRWLALVHVFIMLLLNATKAVPPQRGWFLFVLALIYTGIVMLLRDTILENNSCWLPFLAIDLLVCGMLQTFGGGWRSAWYLYSFNPILVAAFLYHIEGALVTAAISSLLYLLSVTINGQGLLNRLLARNLDDLISNLFSYFLCGVIFAYPCILFDRLIKTRLELAKAHENLESSKRQLSILYKASPLTKREIEVLKLLAESKSNREIAAELFISEETVKSHVKKIFRKLNLKSRTEAASFFWQLD